METFHNPDRFMGDLRQILSQGRKRIGLLVGAGAPMSVPAKEEQERPFKGPPLIPGADQLTNLVLSGLIDGNSRIVVGQIRADVGPGANIETILSRIRLLERAIGNVKVHGLNSAGYAQLGKQLCEQIGNIVNAKLPDFRNGYNDLVAWVSGTVREHPVEIFTTNYDLLFEEAFERVRMPYFDGFSGGASPFFDAVSVSGDDLPSRWSRVWKLHGSLGWRLDGDVIVRSGGKGEAQLIYPDHLKYDLTKKQPYTALFERLRAFLLEPDTLLLATGFSFRDAHICAVLDEALAMNANGAVIAFQFGKLDQETPACKLAYDRPNMSVYCADGAVISGVRGAWRFGPPPKGWQEIRDTFWSNGQLSLGDFERFSRFCALTQATDMKSQTPTIEDNKPIAEDQSSTTDTNAKQV